MRVYKYANIEYCKPWSFRLGTLYEYRREEALGSSIGDKAEGSYQLEYEFPIETTDEVAERLQKHQKFPFMYAKGTREEKHFYALTSSNLLVFSAIKSRDDSMYEEFQGTNCCVAIDDFYSFSKKLLEKVNAPIVKWHIQDCKYSDKT